MQLHRLKWQQNARTLCRHGNENAAALVTCTCFCSAFDYVEILQKLKIFATGCAIKFDYVENLLQERAIFNANFIIEQPTSTSAQLVLIGLFSRILCSEGELAVLLVQVSTS